MKIPMFLLNRDTFALYLAFDEAFRDLYRGFRTLIQCIYLTILLTPIIILELLLETFESIGRIVKNLFRWLLYLVRIIRH